MTITVQIPPNIERQIRKSVSLGETDTVRRLLLEILESAVETLMDNNPQLSDDEFEALADQLADEFMVSVGPDCPTIIRLRSEPRRAVRRTFIVVIYLTDTNFLLRFSYRTDPRHQKLRQ